ncbi:MAG: TMEM165/GDT1 family protein [Tistlia sp.]|uniref:TMEM165/GDT1 family protein n=1 Tax=Tistlia sp. TaxID=3057121 RepID=UPI0034A3F8FA
MDVLLTSLFVVAVAEIGDKTQLLAILLASRYGRPWPIACAILVATLANHGLAALAGAELAAWFEGPLFAGLVGAGFLAMAAWALVPDRLEEEAARTRGRDAFLATLVAFFLVEIGDKTQVATVALAARFGSVVLVTLGTTLGMLLANLPALFLGHRLLRILPLRALRLGAALLFALLGLWILAEAAGLA